MDFSKLREIGCQGIILPECNVIYDEASLAICRKNEKIIFKLDQLPKLIKALQQAETDMIENYKNMSLDEKVEFCKYHRIEYSTLQKIITLRGETT